MRLLLLVMMSLFSISAVAEDEQLLKCIVSLQNYVAEYPWHSEYEGSFDDGVAPLATFKILEPQQYKSKSFSVLFKYQYFQNMLPTLATSPNKQYLLYLPVGFLNSEANVINTSNSLGFTKYVP